MFVNVKRWTIHTYVIALQTWLCFLIYSNCHFLIYTGVNLLQTWLCFLMYSNCHFFSEYVTLSPVPHIHLTVPTKTDSVSPATVSFSKLQMYSGPCSLVTLFLVETVPHLDICAAFHISARLLLFVLLLLQTDSLR